MLNGGKSKRSARHGAQYVLALAAITALGRGGAYAASGTWNGNSSADWFIAGNWDHLPGSTTVTNTLNADTATFNSNPANGNGTSTRIVIDSNLDVGQINFDTNAGNFVIGSTSGNALELSQTNSGGSTTQILPTLTAGGVTETINAPIVIEPNNAASYIFANNAADPSTTLVFGSTVMGATFTTNAGTGLTLAGTNTGNNTVAGDISTGGAATFNFTKAAQGTWNINGNVNINGTFSVTAGTLNSNVSSAGAYVLGTGNFVVDSTLTLNNLSAGDVTYSSASGAAANTFTFGQIGGYESKIAFNAAAGSGGNVTYTIGNASDVDGTDFVKRSFGYLLIAPSALADLGASEKLIINGVAATTGTIYAPYIFVQDPGNHLAADFVTYTGATNGLETATAAGGVYVEQSGTDINSVSVATPPVFDVDQAGAALTANRSVSALRTAFSMNLGGFTLAVVGANYHKISGSGSQAGLILNGNNVAIGSAAGDGTLSFGSTGGNEAIIYTAQNATINSALTSTGLTIAGPGTLTLNGTVNLHAAISHFNSPGNTVINGAITDSAGIFYLGYGDLTLNADNSGSFSGGVVLGAGSTIATGTVTLGNNAAAGTGAITFLSGLSTTGPLISLQANTPLDNIANPVIIGERTGGVVSIAAFGGSNSMTFTGAISAGTNATETILNNLDPGATLSFSGGTLSRLSTVEVSTIFAGSGNTVFGDVIAESGAVTMSGTGSLTLTGSNTYTGATSITSGTMIVSGAAGSINSTPSITVNGAGAAFLYSSSVPETAPITITKGTIGGSGTISASGGVKIGTNATISPGNSPAAQTYTTGVTLANGGTYKWELNLAGGSAGTNYDQLDAQGGSGLTITATSGAFTIDITSLKPDDTPGDVADFDNTHNYAWLIASTSGLTGYDPADFTLSTANFSNDIGAGTFALHLGSDTGTPFALDGNSTDLYLTFTGGTPVPEPASLALLALGGVGLLMRRRRHAQA